MPTWTPGWIEMRWFRWNDGRQRSGYTVLPLFMSKRFDLYLLRYRKGDGIADHRDPVPGRRHFRLNWIVWNAAEGGEFKCTDTIWSTGRIKLFRPDINTHSVDPIRSGSRWVLSVGWTLSA